MFHDIGDKKLHNEYVPRRPKDRDVIVSYRSGKLFYSDDGGKLKFPLYREIEDFCKGNIQDLKYLISVDDTGFFLVDDILSEKKGYGYKSLVEMRRLEPEWLCFAGVTAAHLCSWYDSNRFCGRCGSRFISEENERALICPSCGQVIYPAIAPVIIVGVTDGDRLLLTKYSDKHSKYRRFALNAGFVEIGETLEDTVRREIMEEVGLSVKNIRYYKSQPWGFTNSLLMGFFADVDGITSITLDKEELSEAIWFDRRDLPKEDTLLSLTWNMIEAFRNGDMLE